MSTPTIAIIGSGPSGCFMAQALRREWPDAEITLIERLPVPYGLVRYGVAPDHPGTKAVTRQFERMFEREKIRFLGNVHVGTELPWQICVPLTTSWWLRRACMAIGNWAYRGMR